MSISQFIQDLQYFSGYPLAHFIHCVPIKSGPPKEIAIMQQKLVRFV